jgi:addiction module RelB/DinJ family antitoxin
MNTASISIKTERGLKTQAQKVADKMGVSLTEILNRYLKHFVKTKSMAITTENEIPSDYLIATLKKAENNLLREKTSPKFDNIADEIAWLEKQGI